MKNFIRRSNRLRRRQSTEPFFSKEIEGGAFSPEKAPPFFNQLPLQTKLSIGQPGDKYERQADVMADRVVNTDAVQAKRKPDSEGFLHRQAEEGEEELQTALQRQNDPEEEEMQTSLQKQEEEEEPLQAKAENLLHRQAEEGEEEMQTSLQKQEEEEEPVQAKEEGLLNKQTEEGEEEMQTSLQKQEEEEEPLQAKSKGCACQASSGLEAQLKRNAGGGQPLPAKVRRPMESAFGADFRQVRIHTDAGAVQMNRQLRANAFTHGKNIYFNSGQYRPETSTGKHLLAHELTHTLQQGAVQKKEEIHSSSSPIVQKQPPTGEATQAETDHLDALRASPRDILSQLNIARLGRYCSQNCPAAAMAVQHYIETGEIQAAHCNLMREDEGSITYVLDDSVVFSRSYSRWSRARGAILGRIRQHGDYVVVEARRSRQQQQERNLTEFHYFVVVNIRETIFAVDAFNRGQVTQQLDSYVSDLHVSSFKLVNGRFLVHPTITRH